MPQVPKLPILYNPASGIAPKDPDALLRPLPRELRDRVDPIPFGPPWDFEPHIARAQRAEGPLLVWGGDGTIHHAAKALIDRGCPVPLGAIPGGSGNGLVRGLRTPLEPAGALHCLLEGRELRMDLPRLDGEPFLNVCGTGFEAAVAHRFAALPGRGFGTPAPAGGSGAPGRTPPWPGMRTPRPCPIPRGALIASGRLSKRTDLRPATAEETAGLAPGHYIVARIHTGRTHQIRVHLAHLGRPILGDALYGGAPSGRLWLHAWQPGLKHPVTGEDLRLEAPPARFQA